ncbi:MAG: hypothetical protein Kow0069_17320 [Promethearchaeota archaeon]
MKLDYGWTSPRDFQRWGPYATYGRSAASEVRVAWQSKFYSTSAWLEFWEAPSGERRRLELDADPPRRLFWFALDGLRPGAEYRFQTSRPEDHAGGGDPPTYAFRTAPPDDSPEPFEFLVVGDVHARDGSARTLFEVAKRCVPGASFAASCGDAVTHGGREEAWNEFFWCLDPFLPGLPVVHATGNHDTDHPETYAAFLRAFPQPYVDPANGAYFDVVHGNAALVVLDSTNAGQTSATQGLVSDEQLDWLDATLARHHRAGRWKFVFLHHPVFSTGDSGTMKVYQLAYGDLFAEHQVDAAFYGHDHQFEAYWADRDADWGGTHYFCVGNGGPELGLKAMDRLADPPPTYLWEGRTLVVSEDGVPDGRFGGPRDDESVAKWQVYGALETGFTQVRVEGDACLVRAWDLNGRVLFEDSFARTGAGKRYHPPRVALRR